MAKSIILVGFLLLTFSFLQGQDNKHYTKEEKIIIERVKWLYQLKQVIGKGYWPGYNTKKNDVVLAYFTNTATYIVNPDNDLRKRLKLSIVYTNKAISIYQNHKRVDEKEFHMETAFDDTDSTMPFYKVPVMMCSDFETTTKFVEDVNSIQKWASMVMHEYFHGFQFKHKSFLRYANDSISISGTKLQSFYDLHKWFKDGVDKENALLLSCLSSTDRTQIKTSLKQLIALRKERRAMFKDSLHFDISHQEDFFEKTEGSARYMEWQLLKSFYLIPVNQNLKKIDTAYKENTYKKFTLESEPWLYQTNSIRYFYATGFNYLRLLDKLKIKYKTHFFDDNTLTPYALISKFVQD